MEKDLRDELQERIAILKKNREMISIQELKTKYATSYNALLDKIKSLLSTYMLDYILTGLYVTEKDTEIITLLNTWVTENHTLLSHLVYKQYDLDGLDKKLLEIRMQVVDIYITKQQPTANI